MKKNKLISPLLMCCFSLMTLSLQAQSTVKGRVTDENRNPMSGVTIRLFTPDTVFIKGMASDSIGQYSLKEIDFGTYLLVYSTIGYETHYRQLVVNAAVMDVPSISLAPQTVHLGEVAVKGTSFVRKDDRMLVLPNTVQRKHASTGYDLLYNLMIPGISVEPRKGKVTSFGNEVSLYIDGRKAEYREVANLRPRDVERVEYYDVPTGKYAGDFAVINYITKQYRSGGYIAVDAMQVAGYLKGDYNGVLKIDKGHTNYTLFAGYGMQEHDGTREERDEEYWLDGYHVSRHAQTTDSRVKSNNQYYQLYISDHREKRTLTGSASLIRNVSPENSWSKLYSYSGDYTNEQYAHAHTWQRSMMPELYLYSAFKLKGGKQLEFSTRGNYTDNSYSRTYEENNQRSVTDVKEDFYNINFNANYVMPLKRQGTLAFRLYHFHKISSSTYTNNTRQHLWSAESLLFTEYRKQLSKRISLRIQPGISSLQYRLRGEKRISQISPRLQTSISIRPVQNQFVQFGFNVGNSYPQINTINTVSQEVDLLRIKRGNADMKHTNLYMVNTAYSIGLGKVNMQAAFSYLYANNMPSNYYTAENRRLIESYRDGSRYHNLSAYLSATWKLNEHFNVKMDSYFLRMILKGNTSFQNSAFVGMLNVNYFWKELSVNLHGVLPRYSVGHTYDISHRKIHAEYGMNIGWNQKAWRVEAGVDNPFGKSFRNRMWLDTDVYHFHSSIADQTEQPSGYVKVAYTLDFGRKTERTQNSVNRSTNSAIMKME